MNNEISQRIELLLDEAERNHRCLIAKTDAENKQLLRRVKTGYLASPQPRYFMRAQRLEQLDKSGRALHILRSCALEHPSWIFCCYSAALAYGLAVSNSLLGNIHIVSSKSYIASKRSKVIHHKIAENKCTYENGIPCTAILQTLFDCARLSSFPTGLAIVDSALHLKLASPDSLHDWFRANGKGWKGVHQARRIAQYASPLAESGGESIARALMIELGYQVPLMQVPIADPTNPSKTYRVDFLWKTSDGRIIIGEFDGREKYRNQKMTKGQDLEAILLNERLRESRIGVYGAQIMRFGFKDLMDLESFNHLLRMYGVPRA